ncbi:uncharacterized protein LOC144106253 [Amblyomma americanum]
MGTDSVQSGCQLAHDGQSAPWLLQKLKGHPGVAQNGHSLQRGVGLQDVGSQVEGRQLCCGRAGHERKPGLPAFSQRRSGASSCGRRASTHEDRPVRVELCAAGQVLLQGRCCFLPEANCRGGDGNAARWQLVWRFRCVRS